MARISLEPPKTLSYRIGARFARRRYGVMPDPGAAIAHNTKVGRSYALFELAVERWRALDHGLKDLAVMAAAAKIGCAWCMGQADRDHGGPDPAAVLTVTCRGR